MKKVQIRFKSDETFEDEVPEGTSIFVKKGGRLEGMIVQEGSKGWITRIGGPFGSSDHYETRAECMKKAQKHGFEFFIED